MRTVRITGASNAEIDYGELAVDLVRDQKLTIEGEVRQGTFTVNASSPPDPRECYGAVQMLINGGGPTLHLSADPPCPRAGRLEDRHRQAHRRVPDHPLQLHEHPGTQAAALACISARIWSAP